MDAQLTKLKNELDNYRKKMQSLKYNLETTKTEIFHANKPLEKAKNDLNNLTNINDEKQRFALNKIISRNTQTINEHNKEIIAIEAEIIELEPKITELEKKLLPYEIMSGMKFK